MASYATNEFKSGLKVLVDGEPCSILENEVVKPGKGQAFNRVKFRNLRNGRGWERTFKAGESKKRPMSWKSIWSICTRTVSFGTS